jgi:uncharacterized protein with HEPN domain
MARGDKEWVEDTIAAVTDIRADTYGMDFAAFAAKPVVVRSVLYSIAVIGGPRRTSARRSRQRIRTFIGGPLLELATG